VVVSTSTCTRRVEDATASMRPVFQRVIFAASSVMTDAYRAAHKPRPASRASLSSALKSAIIRNGNCV
jgi:hypothetical protein